MPIDAPTEQTYGLDVIPAWLWLVAGLALIGAELFVAPTGLYLLFFGASALVVGAVAISGAIVDPAAQLLLFAAVSAADLLLFRRAVAERLHVRDAKGHVAELVGETAVALGPVAANAVGSAELRGTVWRARNVGKFDLAKGQRCLVEQVEGLELRVRGV